STKIYKWLNPPDCSANHAAATDKKCAGTGEWIFGLDEYQSWKLNPSMLWIQGPDSFINQEICRTTILQDVQLNSNAVWYHYFDTRDNTGLKTTYRGFLLSFIQQIGLEDKGINPALYTLYKSNKFKQLTSSELQKVLGIMIKERNGGYIVVDAMDECQESDEVLNYLSAFSGQLWILVTSRIHAGGFGKGVLEIALGSKESSIDKDIVMYLNSKINPDSKFKGEIGANIKESLRKGAHGVFHWVDCQLRGVLKCTTRQSVKRVLGKLPQDLQETYKKALERCREAENAEEAQHLLLWLLYAYEPLTTEQISEILAVDLREQVIDNPYMEVQVEMVIDSTLVTVGQDNIVQLAHASVKEYLISYSQETQTKNLFELNEHLAHDILTRTTIIYLMQKEYVSYNETPFVFYGVKNWLSHASKVEEYKLKGKAQSLIQIMLDDNELYFAKWEEMYLRYENPWKQSTQATPLYYGALHGLGECVQKLISEKNPQNARIYININGGKYGNALQAASFKGHEAIVKLLLEKGAEVNAQGGAYGNALQAASSQGHETIIELLLDNGAVMPCPS
ncbi:hypothetical protein GG344DRAFT_58855, partial [Lentinula edodes]